MSSDTAQDTTKEQASIDISEMEDPDFDELLDTDVFRRSDISESEIVDTFEMLKNLHCDLDILFTTTHIKEDEQDSLSSVGFRFLYDEVAVQYIHLPGQPYNSLVCEYDLLEDLALTSNHELFGGDTQQMAEGENIKAKIEEVLNDVTTEQLAYVLASNRALNMTLIESTLSSLDANAPIPVNVQFRRIGPDFVGNSIVHNIYGDIELEDLYEKLSNITSLQSAYVDTIGSQYLTDGVTVPKDVASYSDDPVTQQTTQTRTNGPAFQ